jgi:hypothetical protein
MAKVLALLEGMMVLVGVGPRNSSASVFGGIAAERVAS